MVAKELIDENPRWRMMTNHIQSTTTVAMQIWSDHSSKDLRGTSIESNASVGNYPLATYSDMSRTTDWEEGESQHVSYLCGAMADPEPNLTDRS